MATRDGCCAMKRRAAMVIAFLLVGMGAAASVTQGHATVDDCAPGDPLTPKAEMFATNNTETIADQGRSPAARPIGTVRIPS